MTGISCEAQVNQMCVSWLSSLGGCWVLGTAWAWRPLWTMDECLGKEVERRWLSRVESLILGCWLHSSAISFQESSDVFLVDFKGNTGIPTPTDLGTNNFNSAPNLLIWHQNLNLHFRFVCSFLFALFTPQKHVTCHHQAMMLGICGLPAESLQDMSFSAWLLVRLSTTACIRWRRKRPWSQRQKHGCPAAFVNNCTTCSKQNVISWYLAS